MNLSVTFFLLGVCVLSCNAVAAEAATSEPAWLKDAMAKAQGALVQRYGEAQRGRVERGVRQVGEFWRAGDGTRWAR